MVNETKKNIKKHISLLMCNKGFFTALIICVILHCILCVVLSALADQFGLKAQLLYGSLWQIAVFGFLALWGGKTSKVLLSVFVIIQNVIFFTGLYLAWRFSLPLRGDSLLVLAVSSPQEVRDFIKAIFDWKTILAFITCAATTFLLIFLIWESELKRIKVWSILCIIMILPSFLNTARLGCKGVWRGAFEDNITLNFFISIYDAQTDTQKLKDMAENPILPKNVIYRGNNKQLIILVIGESVMRYHLSLYGYPRNTTPCLNEKHHALLVYNDVIANYATTIRAMRHLLTTEDMEHPLDFRFTAFDIFKEAQYKILFYSNQARWGRYDSPIGLITAHADERIYFQEKFVNPFDEICFDEGMKVIENANSPTLLVLHTMGSHISFANRTPNQYKIFSEKNRFDWNYSNKQWSIVDSYDAAAYYTDSLLEKLLTKVDQADIPVCCIYLSDHGEYPYQEIGRSSMITDVVCYEIPFFLYANEAYRKAFPDFMKNAAANTDKPYQTDQFMYALFSVAQITFDNFPYEKDIFSSQYVPPAHRYISDKKVEYHYRPNPYLSCKPSSEQ